MPFKIHLFTYSHEKKKFEREDNNFTLMPTLNTTYIVDINKHHVIKSIEFIIEFKVKPYSICNTLIFDYEYDSGAVAKMPLYPKDTNTAGTSAIYSLPRGFEIRTDSTAEDYIKSMWLEYDMICGGWGRIEYSD